MINTVETTNPPMCQFQFTVFTPTYNRAHTLHRVYDSLKQQTYRHFEWLIVDGGSDETPNLIKNWAAESDFTIRYLQQKTKGLHLAFNEAVAAAKGELFLTLHSDDACLPDALAKLKYHWDSISQERKAKFSGVTGFCLNQYGNLIGNPLNQAFIDSDSREIRYKYKVNWEMWGFQKTEVMKEFPFPAIEEQRFVPECVVWGAIASKYKTRFINEPLRVYWMAESEETDQLTSFTNPAQHAVGHALWHQIILDDEIGWFLSAPTDFLRSAVHYARFSFHKKEPIVKQYKNLSNWLAKLLWLIMLPIGYFVYSRDVSRQIVR